MQPEKNKNEVPVNSCVFNDIAVVDFAEKDKGYDFSINGYSGKEIKNHWWWGNLAFDLQGLKFSSKKTPVLQEHQLSNRIGVANNQGISDHVFFEGNFLKNAKAQELKSDMKDGFPMQASLSLVPTAVEYLKENETSQVNGFTLKGPGAIFRKAAIKEVSMCVFGADSNTSSKAFADGGECHKFSIVNSGKENEMPDKVENLTLESFADNHPDIHEQVAAKFRAEGKNEAQKQFDEKIDMFVDQFGDDPAFCLEMIKAGVEFADAVKKQAEKLKKEKAEFAAKATGSETAATGQVDAAETEFSDDTAPVKKEDMKKKSSFDESSATEDELKAHFAEDKKLQSEHVSADSYVAFVQSERGEI